MTFLNEEKPSLNDALEHHGVKGQKWGVRKAARTYAKNVGVIHTEKVNKGIAINQRVASGTGTKRDTARVVLGSNVGRLATKGVKGTATKNEADLQAHLDRLNSGNATVKDVLVKYGNLSAADLGKAALKGHKV